jgi:hypothetical protein
MSAKHIPAALVRRVRRRVGQRCEYCQLPQNFQEAVFHVDHIWPRYAGGLTHLDNLALACVTCSLRKGSRTQALDPQGKRKVRLFNPRIDRWLEHFAWTSLWRIRGKTARGRATVRALGMNRPAIVVLRQTLAIHGLWPEA